MTASDRFSSMIGLDLAPLIFPSNPPTPKTKKTKTKQQSFFHHYASQWMLSVNVFFFFKYIQLVFSLWHLSQLKVSFCSNNCAQSTFKTFSINYYWKTMNHFLPLYSFVLSFVGLSHKIRTFSLKRNKKECVNGCDYICKSL